jgi:hypothetical protein
MLTSESTKVMAAEKARIVQVVFGPRIDLSECRVYRDSDIQSSSLGEKCEL